ncbi:MAG TPA: hypothetical protein VD713_07045 [Sphingomonadales bacterium]|nr:hypothetical protein [Sphingomonadales bacterium]
MIAPDGHSFCGHNAPHWGPEAPVNRLESRLPEARGGNTQASVEVKKAYHMLAFNAKPPQILGFAGVDGGFIHF